MANEIEISANIKSNVGQLSKDVDKATDSTQKLVKETDKAEGGFMGMKMPLQVLDEQLRRQVF